ncbi:hypothetical protein AMATHDRAFT_2784 [Amanita thiersii Skay4041]|uniref:Uncharacterized protein n=1 Tax=Amanita thiersii Skay4041 TaxID=703135 RepID=A0A2A9NNJ8_9AGAR|nr:hypothetical protein AMATHDRAFT_2784 [Amanita thiersii Skay4041]
MSSKLVLSSLTLLAGISAASVIMEREPTISPSIIICTGNLNTSNGCLTVPVVSAECINLTGGLSFANDELSTARIPGGLVCTFYDQFGCSSPTGEDTVVLTGGDWSFTNAPAVGGPVNFNDRASSFTCSPL